MPARRLPCRRRHRPLGGTSQPLSRAADGRADGRMNTPVPVMLLAAAVGAAAWGCAEDQGADGATVATKAASRAPAQMEVRHADHFEVEYFEGFKVVRTRGEVAAFQSNEDGEPVEDVVVLVPRGQTPDLPAHLSGAYAVETPIRRFALNNDDILALVTELGVRDQLVGVGGLFTYDDTVRARIGRGEIGQVQYSWHLPPDIEVLLDRGPDVTFMAMDSPHNVPALGRTRDLGLVTAPAFVWAERDALARAEWIKFFAAFFDLETEATRIFDEVEARFLELESLASDATVRPSALWGYHAGDGRWFMAVNNLEARLLASAGVVNPLADLNAPVRRAGDEFSHERLLLEGAEAEHWIIGDIHAAELPPAGFLQEFAAWRDGRLYHNYARSNWDVNAYDWYESAVVRADLALADLVHIFHPQLLPDHELVYFGVFER
ncbi:MAG: ABC transporter substrate-binding protein [Gammaproteobacteria bacterium]|nr:ABC transporter substrate-binding protein [Gammaproteobacteria bacterium]MYC53330.1 ABC transporter substrate-binding protein [Gammaproteobacteria bacterium]